MTIEQSVSDFLQATGTVGYILLAIAGISVIITLYKLFEYLYMGVLPNPIGKNRWKKYFAGVKNAEQTEALGVQYVESLQHGFLILSLIVTITPLLGLLGTVIGMIDAFQVMASLGDAVNVASLASGIWKALITTAAGLSIAIFVLVMSNLFQFLLDKHINKVNVNLKKC